MDDIIRAVQAHVDAAIQRERDDRLAERERYERQIEILTIRVNEAERHEGMFRRALHKHLTDEQQFGVTQPETLEWIEQIVRSPE